MIQPGQKLKEGDYTVGVNESDWNSLFDSLKNTKGQLPYPKVNNQTYAGIRTPVLIVGITYNVKDSGVGVLKYSGSNTSKNITCYNFADFKQLCENTFGDGN